MILTCVIFVTISIRFASIVCAWELIRDMRDEMLWFGNIKQFLMFFNRLVDLWPLIAWWTDINFHCLTENKTFAESPWNNFLLDAWLNYSRTCGMRIYLLICVFSIHMGASVKFNTCKPRKFSWPLFSCSELMKYLSTSEFQPACREALTKAGNRGQQMNVYIYYSCFISFVTEPMTRDQNIEFCQKR